MLVPLTVGRLIDFFSTNAVSQLLRTNPRGFQADFTRQSAFFGLSFPVAAGLLAVTFCVGAAANAGEW